MARQLAVAIAEGLEQCDLLALGADQARHHHMKQEDRDQQEDRWQDRGLGALLIELLLEEAMRRLVVSGAGTGAAVAGESHVQGVDDAFPVGPRLKGQRELVEGAFHAVGVGQGRLVHPEDGVAPVVGDQVGRAGLVEKFGAQGDAAQRQAGAAAIDDCLDVVARNEPVGRGEGVAGYHLILAPGHWQLASQQVQAVEGRLATVGNRHQLATYRVGEVRYRQSHRAPHARLDEVDPGQALQALDEAQGSAGDVGEHLGEVVAGIEAGLGPGQRVEHRHREDQGHHPAADHHGDGQRLPLQSPEVA